MYSTLEMMPRYNLAGELYAFPLSKDTLAQKIPMSYKSPAILLFLEQKPLTHFIFPWPLAYATRWKYEWVIGNILGSPNEIKNQRPT